MQAVAGEKLPFPVNGKCKIVTENEITVYGVPGKTHAVPEHFYILSHRKHKEMHWTDKSGRHIGWVRLLERRGKQK